MTNILSIQSWVSYGHVGNAAAVFPLQRLGACVWAVNTVQFSNHPGHGDWTGRVGTGAEVTALVEGIERRGVFAQCDAVLSGYMGDPSVGDAVLEAVVRVRAANPRALYCCDPVIGDAGRVYVRDGIPALIAERAIPQADLLTPNQFELERLSGVACVDTAAVRLAIGVLRARMRPGPRAVLLTSAVTADTPEGMLEIVAADDHGMQAVQVPTLAVAASGAGDMMAALFLFHFLRTGRAGSAMAEAAAAVHAVLRVTAARGGRDLLLVEAQDLLHAPDRLFPPRDI
ncbi:MAG: pyridoxal kinase PdxY [Acetobacteraceae bacterium]|nr:pyridoxal kinase PdxY [Acetobacteraceae bacterium]